MKKPKLGASPARQDHIAKAKPTSEIARWAFSFQHWRQIEYFGVSECEAKWFVSFLERLRELASYPVDQFLADQPTKDAWRYHDVKWTIKNIPIKRSQLDWLPAEFRDNDAEYPLFQFMVSQSLGRVVGFWVGTGEARVFHIVLLDPEHNIHPTAATNHRVDACWPLTSDYGSILLDLDDVRKNRCKDPECPFPTALRDVGKLPREGGLLRIPVAQEAIEYVGILQQDDPTATLAQILDCGITNWEGASRYRSSLSSEEVGEEGSTKLA